GGGAAGAVAVPAGRGRAAVGRRDVDRRAELDEPLAGQRDRAERAEPREERRDREVRGAEQAGQRLDVTDQRVDLLGADDGDRDDRGAGAQGRADETAAAEALQLVPVAERLADALEALREHADQLAPP